MENASKALLMAGGVLITLLVIGAFMLMINTVSDYQKSNSQITSNTQLVKFNEQFTQYIRNDLKGVDLISLTNRVDDYNKKTGGVGEIDYSEKITLTININRAKYIDLLGGEEPTVFTKPKYVIDARGDVNGFYDNITKCRKLEENNSINNLKKLISKIDDLKDGETKVYDIIKGHLKDSQGNSLDDVRDLEQIIKILKDYQEYSAFKFATFNCYNTVADYYESGQIRSLTVDFIK